VITRPQPVEAAAAVARALGERAFPAWWCAQEELEAGVLPTREYVACDPIAVVRGDSLAELTAAWSSARALWAATSPAPLSVPVGVGFFSYDLGRAFHALGGTPPPPSGWPGLEFRFYDACWVRGRSGACEIWAANEAAAAALASKLVPAAARPSDFDLSPFRALEPPAQHLASIQRVLDYLVAGDAYQVNLARRLSARLAAAGPPGLELFTRLCASAAAPFALWLADPARGRAVIGNSPERFLRLSAGRTLETAPIKGTRPRGAGVADDAALLAALTSDPKDRAEHVMIVDLERNDLGRICEVGSVSVVQPFRVLTLPSVLHLETTVRGRLRAGVELAEILHATFPGGSITGAPKRRAMQIIDELEPAQRGPYTGATGWLGAAGDFDLAVAIRTAVLEGEALTLWVGGGIVADSTPAAELTETEVKARAFAALCTRELV
jgi:anthranilate/para-aminobenzoate synthase component I